MTTVWIGIILSATVIGFLVGRLRQGPVRAAVYAVLILAPALAFTLILAFTPPAPPGFVAWWMAGMVMIGPALVAWAMLTSLGFAAARWSVR